MEPDRFGPYRLEALLGRRGTGAVYRALDTEDDREVALEVLSEELTADPGYRERFHREAELAAGLDEPHAVPVHRSGELEGRLFLDSALVPGWSLSDVLAEDGPLAPARAVSIVGQTARALDAASAAGLHRDVTPADVMLTGTGDDEAVHLTGLGAPPVDEPSDAGVGVRALARLLSACLTGVPVPAGSDPEAPSAVRPGVPAALDDVVRRGLATERGEGYAACGDLADAAAAALRTPGDAPVPFTGAGAGPSTSGHGRRPGRLPLLLAGTAVLAALAAVLWLVLGGGAGDDDQAGTGPTTAPRTQLVTTTPSAPPRNAAEDELRAIIPGEFISVDCDTGEPTADGALAVLGCGSSRGQPGPEDSVFYLYEDAAAADEVFQADMERNGVAPLPAGAQCPDVQGYGPYEDDDGFSGRVACYVDEDNNAIIAWTQDDVAAEGWVIIIDGGEIGLEFLWLWWIEPETSDFVPRI